MKSPTHVRRLCFLALLFISTARLAAESSAAAWIWQAATAEATPAEAVGFRREFSVPATENVSRAVLELAADDRAQVFFNGQDLGSLTGWSPLKRVDLGPHLRAGNNVLAIRVENLGVGPAGLFAKLTIDFRDDPKSLSIGSDEKWLCGPTEIDAWKASESAGAELKPALVIGRDGDLPWGLLMPPDGEKTFAEMAAPGENLSGLNELLQRFHPHCKMAACPAFSLAWLPQALLWVADAPAPGDYAMRAQIRQRLTSIRMSGEGYVSCHQHEGLAHSEGWPFPMPSQSSGFAYYFCLAGNPYGPEFGVQQTSDLTGWKLENAKAGVVDAASGWRIELMEPQSVATSPTFKVDALVTPFVRVKWNATELPAGSRPYLEWTTAAEPEFDAARRLDFPQASGSSAAPIQDFDIPIHQFTAGQGSITGLRIGFRNPTPGAVTILRIFSAVDSRHTVNNSNYLIAASDYFDWTGDVEWLKENLPKLRLALKYMIDEFQVREAKLLRTPWIGHDGQSGIEYLADGTKVVTQGRGVGGNYWDLLPFGGDDALATIYLYHAISRMAAIEKFLAGQSAEGLLAPASDAASLTQLAAEVREKYQATFWNPETGRFAPKDHQGTFRDYGFTFLNNEAIYYGLASETQAQSIIDWLDGHRLVATDTAQGADIYRWICAPRASTKRNLDYYSYVWFMPENLKFGDQVQDGGAVLGFSYHDMMARIRTVGPDNAWKRLQEILEWHRAVEKAGGVRAYYREPGRGTLQGGGTAGGLGVDEEFWESVCMPAIVLDGFVGFEPSPSGFRIAPQLPTGVPSMAVRNIAYRNMRMSLEVFPARILLKVLAGQVDAPLKVVLPPGAWIAKITGGDGIQKMVEVADGIVGFSLDPGLLSGIEIEKSLAGQE